MSQYRWNGFCIMYDPHESEAERDGELIDKRTKKFIREFKDEPKAKQELKEPHAQKT